MSTPFVNKKLHKVLVYYKNYGGLTVTCNIWSRFKFQAGDATPLVFTNTAVAASSSSLWGTMTWGPTGTGVWGSTANNKIEVMEFNSKNLNGNDLGDAFKLQFTNTDSTTPVEIIGFSVYYTEATR